MKLETIFNEYIIKSNQLILAKRSMNEIALNEIGRLVQKKEKEEKITGSKDSTHSMDFFFIQDAKTGETQRYNHIEKTVDENIKYILLQKNKQYQWILSESYEIFKDYLIKVYAHLGYTDKNMWPLKDFGSIVLSELDKKDFYYFLEQAKTKRDIPDSILNRIRSDFPEYKRIESCNKLNKNLLFTINLIENFRHVIVHCGGKTTDKNSMIEKILKKSGLWNNGKYNQENFEYISSFFSLNDVITLLEIESNARGNLPGGYYDILNNLIDSLTSSAYLIFCEINELKK
jgi:hypothetical protein